jgi:hypothetical protein
MRISEALSPAVPLEVVFPGGGVLNIVYRPAGTSIAATKRRMETILASAKGRPDKRKPSADDIIGRVEEMQDQIAVAETSLDETFLPLIVSWDLTEEDGETVVPLTLERVSELDSALISHVMQAIKNHQAEAGAGKK